MPFVKGQKNPNAGRPKGATNKGIEKLRKSIATLTERNYPRLTEALQHVEAQDPAKFVDLYLKLLQYTLPKLESVKQELEVSEETLDRITIEIKTRNSGSNDSGQ